MANLYNEGQVYNALQNNIKTYGSRYSVYLESARSSNKDMDIHKEHNLVMALKTFEDVMTNGYNKNGDGIMAFRKEDVQKFIDQKYIREDATRPADFDSFIHYGFDVITSMLTSNPVEEFMTIQSIDKQMGEIYYMDFIKSSNKGSHAKGSSYMSANSGPHTGEDYSSEKIPLEECYNADGSTLAFSGKKLNWLPLKASNVTITFVIGGTTYSVTDNGAGHFIHARIASSTLNYVDGQLDVTFTQAVDSATKVFATYVQDSAREDVNQNPQITVKLTTKYIYALRRYLLTTWMIDSALILDKHYGKKLDEELLEKTLNGVNNEIAIQCANKIHADATANNSTAVTFTDATNVYYPQVFGRQDSLIKVLDGAVEIEAATQKVTANFIIAGKKMSKICRTLPRDIFSPVKYADKTPTGMRVVGVIDEQYKVIQNTEGYADSQFLIGAKGPDWMTTGAVLAVFIPLMSTPMQIHPSGEMTRGLLTYNGVETVNSDFYCKGTIA